MWYKIKILVAVMALTLFGNISANDVTATNGKSDKIIAQLF